ncbi:hypothetical protein RN001_012924 [Aquatica leii]|uniref:Uncharacterized protein n=1 Tax=Aquatica leii TaxID=1421715 RepID=A0AAN7NZD7_9COLE|nr:hypothetical protein RN001_012924 [Aquatica leii]
MTSMFTHFVVFLIFVVYCASPNTPSSLVNNHPMVRNNVNGEMPDILKLRASSFLWLASSNDVLLIFRKLYSLQYPFYIWHVAKYYAYSVVPKMSVELSLANEHYLLFATEW